MERGSYQNALGVNRLRCLSTNIDFALSIDGSTNYAAQQAHASRKSETPSFNTHPLSDSCTFQTETPLSHCPLDLQILDAGLVNFVFTKWLRPTYAGKNNAIFAFNSLNLHRAPVPLLSTVYQTKGKSHTPLKRSLVVAHHNLA